MPKAAGYSSKRASHRQSHGEIISGQPTADTDALQRTMERLTDCRDTVGGYWMLGRLATAAREHHIG